MFLVGRVAYEFTRSSLVSACLYALTPLFFGDKCMIQSFGNMHVYWYVIEAHAAMAFNFWWQESSCLVTNGIG